MIWTIFIIDMAFKDDFQINMFDLYYKIYIRDVVGIIMEKVSF